MPLIKNGDFVADPWRLAAEGAALPDDANAALIVPLARFRSEREGLLARKGPLGLRLTSAQSPVLLGADIHSFALVVIEFPVFRDGRGFSYARRLRQEMGFAGDIRAVGHILPDQALFLERCGFTELEVKETAKLSDWQRALSEFSVWYQHAADGRRTVLDLRLQRQSQAPRLKSAAPALSLAGAGG